MRLFVRLNLHFSKNRKGDVRIMYFWCTRCHKVFESAEDYPMDCYFGCGAGIYDLRRWEKVREKNPDLPEIPRIKERYDQIKE